jgi:hypothetical protein
MQKVFFDCKFILYRLPHIEKENGVSAFALEHLVKGEVK